MNFYLLLLAYLAVACGVSSAAPAQTQEELDAEFLHKECPFGQRPAYVKEKCAAGVNNPVDCPPIKVKCVQLSFGNTPHASPNADGSHPAGVWKSQEELDNELMHKECPFGQRAVQVKVRCSYGAKDTSDCPPPEIRCVQMSFGNDQTSTWGSDSGRPRAPVKTQEELEQEMLHKQCPPKERPALVKEKCPSGATNTADCPPMEVRCVHSAFANNQSYRPSSAGDSGPEKTQEDLDEEMMTKDCDFGQRPALVKEKCLRGAKNTPDCPRMEVRCVLSSFANDQTEISTQSPERYFEENRWAAEHEQSYPGLHSRVHPFRSGGSRPRW